MSLALRSICLLHFAVHIDLMNTPGLTKVKVSSVANQGANRSPSSFNMCDSTRCLWTHSAATVRSLTAQTSSCAVYYSFSHLSEQSVAEDTQAYATDISLFYSDLFV